MVLKISLAALILSGSFKAYSQYQDMDWAYKNEKYDQVVDIYEDSDSRRKSSSFKVQKLLGLSLKQLGRYNESLSVFEKLAEKTGFAQIERKIKENFQLPDDQREEISVTDEQKFLANQLAHLKALLFLQTNELDGDLAKQKLYQSARTSLQISGLVDEDMDRNHELLEQINVRNSHYRDLKFKRSYYASIQYISWQDHIILVNQTSNLQTKILNTTGGGCAGGGVVFSNKNFDYFVDACYIRGESTASSTTDLVTYHQSQVGVRGLFGGPGFYYKFKESSLHLGLQATVLHRKGEWDTPSGGSYRLDDTSYTRFGYTVQTRWAIRQSQDLLGIVGMQRVSLVAKFGKTFQNESSTYSMGIEFLF